MKREWRLVRTALLVSVLLFTAPLSYADEGMWTFDNPPLRQLQERYGFQPTQEWLGHLRLASVRFNDGGSGSFVSARGLVLTNHHVALGQLQKLSTPEMDYVKSGFHARSQEEELKCPDLELNVLVSMEEVTNRVQGAIKAGMTDQQALEARKAEMAKIEKESLDATGLRSDVVSLYHGGEYWLYRYKKYTDVRLVFAPEQQIAFFGGDPDNFTFPRYCLDMALFRIYENDEPVESRYFLRWNTQGATDGELVFVSGHPGSTDRLETLAQILMERDSYYPYALRTLRRRLEALRAYAKRSSEAERQAMPQIFSLENAIKAFTGEYNGLLDEGLIAKKKKDEEEFRRRISSNAAWKKQFGGAWEMVARTLEEQKKMEKPLRFRSVRGTRLARMAITLVQYVAEVKKPNAGRLDGFHESQLESLRFSLLSPAPIFPAMEEVLLENSLQESLEELGANDPFIKAALQGRPAAEVARTLIQGTRLADPTVRKELLEGGDAAVSASTDSLIVWARAIDPSLREIRKWGEDHVESILTRAGEKIGKARFAVYGKSVNPDANFTLRLSFGAVKGYPMNGTIAPPYTTLYGLYDRAQSFQLKPPFHLPDRFVRGEDRLNLATSVNFVSTADIIGGNSGSPVVNRNGELVGVIFDGNIESLVGRFVYNEENNRAIAVHTAFMAEALRKLYDVKELLEELLGE